MSRISLSGNASGTGTLTIAAPNTNTDRTLTLPDSTGTIATAESTLAQFNASGSAPVYACRAWVNFDGTGTPAIRESGNVSSITDNNAGDYTVNFTTAMPDVNYALTGAGGNDGEMFSYRGFPSFPPTTTDVRVAITNSSGTRVDSAAVTLAIFR